MNIKKKFFLLRFVLLAFSVFSILSFSTPVLAFNPFTFLSNIFENYIVPVETANVIDAQTANVTQADLVNGFQNYVTNKPTPPPVFIPPVVINPPVVNVASQNAISNATIASILRNLLKTKEFSDQLRGPQGVTGPQGIQGPQGPTGATLSSPNFQPAYVGVIQPNPVNNFSGATLFSATNLSSNSFTTNTANVTTLTVTNPITGSIAGNASTVTNGVYTTDAGTVFLAPTGDGSGLTNISYTETDSLSLHLDSNDVVVKHKIGTITQYKSSSNTDVARGTVLLNAFSSAVAGDVIYLSANTFDIETNYLIMPTNGTLIGSGKYSTIIKSTTELFPQISGYPIITVADNSVIKDLSIIAYNYVDNGDPFNPNVRGIIGSHMGPSASNILLENIYTSGATDGIYVNTTNTITMIARNITTDSQWDAVNYNSIGGIFYLYDSIINSVADVSVSSGDLANGVIANNGTVNIFNSVVGALGATGSTRGITANGNANIYMYSGKIVTTGTGTVKDINNSSSGVVGVSSSVNYDTTKISGTITYFNSKQNITNLFNLTGNGFVKTSSGTGVLSIDTSTYLTAETDPVYSANTYATAMDQSVAVAGTPTFGSVTTDIITTKDYILDEFINVTQYDLNITSGRGFNAGTNIIIQTGQPDSMVYGTLSLNALHGNVNIGSATAITSIYGGLTLSDAGYTTCASLTTSGNLVICGASDQTVKQNFQNYSNGLDFIRKIQPQTYSFKEGTVYFDNNRTRLGLIAQEVQAAGLTDAVFPMGNGLLQVDFNAITTATLSAVKELDLNLQGISGTIIPLSGSANESFVNTFFSNVFAKIGTWLGDAGNGIGDFFANKVHTKEICVAKADGTEFCANGDQLEAMTGSGNKNTINNSGGNSGGGSGGDSSPSDNISPIITLMDSTGSPQAGDAIINLNLNDSYVEYGATATDDVDTSVAVIISGAVDTATAGAYVVTYNARDTAGNSAIEVVRTINVGEVAPVVEVPVSTPVDPVVTPETTPTPTEPATVI